MESSTMNWKPIGARRTTLLHRFGGGVIRRVPEMEVALPLEAIFPGVTATDLARLEKWYWDGGLSADPATAQATMSIHSFLLTIDGKKVLIDCCNGNHKTRTFRPYHKLDTDYIARLAAAGAEPHDIDIVICTHLHLDHVGWNTRWQDGRWVPTFPNARYLFPKADFDHFIAGSDPAHTQAIQDSVVPIVETGLATMVEGGHVVFRSDRSRIWLEAAGGHSPGNLVTHASSHDALVVFCGDTFHHPIQLVRPDLTFIGDHDLEQAIATRTRLIASLADTDVVVLPAHFGRSSCGFIKREGDGYRMEFVIERDVEAASVAGQPAC